MALFKKKQAPVLTFDPQRQEPAVRKSICTGEMTVGYMDKATGAFHDLMMVDREGLEEFKRQVGTENIKEIY